MIVFHYLSNQFSLTTIQRSIIKRKKQIYTICTSKHLLVLCFQESMLQTEEILWNVCIYKHYMSDIVVSFIFPQACVYLFSGLSVQLWHPTYKNMDCIKSWLLKADLSSPENQLARYIVSNLNWGHVGEVQKINHNYCKIDNTAEKPSNVSSVPLLDIRTL